MLTQTPLKETTGIEACFIHLGGNYRDCLVTSTDAGTKHTRVQWTKIVVSDSPEIPRPIFAKRLSVRM